jgi:hypothetical protein
MTTILTTEGGGFRWNLFVFLENIFLIQMNEKYGRLDEDPMTENVTKKLVK